MLHYGWKYTYYIHEIQQRKNYSIVALELIKLPEKKYHKNSFSNYFGKTIFNT